MRARFHRPIIAAALLAPLLAACDDAASPEGPQAVAAVAIAPVGRELWAGDLHQLTATPRAADGSPLPDRAVVWSGGDPAVAVVDAAGRLEARGAGSVVVAATSEGKRGEIALTISEADLVFEGYATGFPEIFTLSLRGGEPARVLPPYTLVTDPKPSPDGGRIAFVIANYDDGVGDIWVVNRDGTNLRQLTFDSELDDQPAWSPDGTRIAFRSHRTLMQGDIWVMNADGTNPVNLTPDPLPGVVEDQQPAWSPDGSRIVWASTAGGNMDVWTMRADGSDRRQLTSSDDFDTEPAWSPDGATIVFRRADPTLGADLAAVPAAGGEVTRFHREGHDVAPAWSPDGRLIAFTRFPPDGGSPQIYTMRPDGSEVTLRTSDYRWNGGRNPGWLRRR